MGDHAGFKQLRSSIRRPGYVFELAVPQRPPQASLCCHRLPVPGLASKLRPDGRAPASAVTAVRQDGRPARAGVVAAGGFSTGA